MQLCWLRHQCIKSHIGLLLKWVFWCKTCLWLLFKHFYIKIMQGRHFTPAIPTLLPPGSCFPIWRALHFDDRIRWLHNAGDNGGIIFTVEILKGWCKIRYPPKTHLKLKLLFAHYSFLSCPIVVKLCTKHTSAIALLLVKVQNDKQLKWIIRKKRFQKIWGFFMP